MTRVMRFTLLSMLLLLFALAPTVRAGERTISINGDGNATWFISGEPTLIINGFDLAAFGVATPAFIDRVSIQVDTAVPGANAEVVIYEDANGGSPVDARLVSRQPVSIAQAGVFTAVLPAPVQVNQRALWVGFYLPVDFRFVADTSGASVLTYWGWTPGGTFDLGNLASAAVFGPSDGTAPVNINLNGKARISFEVSATAVGAAATPAAATVSVPQTGVGVGDASVLIAYTECPNVLYDGADERVTWNDAINLHCRLDNVGFTPPIPQGYTIRGSMYAITIFKADGEVLTGRMQFPVTHCIRPDVADLPTAVIGVAWGVPRTWRIQPSQRFGDLVCADIRRIGALAYFIPNGLPTATPSF